MYSGSIKEEKPAWHLVHGTKSNLHSHYCWDGDMPESINKLKVKGSFGYAWKFGVIYMEDNMEFIKEITCKECGRPLDV